MKNEDKVSEMFKALMCLTGESIVNLAARMPGLLDHLISKARHDLAHPDETMKEFMDAMDLIGEDQRCTKEEFVEGLRYALSELENAKRKAAAPLN